MTRRYTTLEELAEAVRTRREQGETYAEIVTSYGLEKKQLKKLMERQKRKERKMKADGAVITGSNH